MADTIFTLSSGLPPCGIAVLRISGPAARTALFSLAGRLPDPRRAMLANLRTATGEMLDQAMVLWLPGPASVTGEDVAELHCHGGRAVVAAVLDELRQMTNLRPAAAGEFTRRGFANGRIDLAEAEGLADLLTAETELQRSAAIAMATGRFSEVVQGWRLRLLTASAQVEAVLDFADEDDVAVLPPSFTAELGQLHGDLAQWLERPRAEVLRDGFRVVIAGPPNAGKSTLFNALVEDEAAITAATAGTTRDVLTRSVALCGIAFVFTDTAGLRSDASDAIEVIGIARAQGAITDADIVLWLGPEGAGPDGCWEIDAQADRIEQQRKQDPRHLLSAMTGAGMAELRRDLAQAVQAVLPKPGAAALNARQHSLLGQAAAALVEAAGRNDPLLTAEELRIARLSFDTLLGHTATEDMLDTLFGRFCIGK